MSIFESLDTYFYYVYTQAASDEIARPGSIQVWNGTVSHQNGTMIGKLRSYCRNPHQHHL